MSKNKKNKINRSADKKVDDISLEISDVSFRYRENLPKALSNVSYKINHGEYVTIVGHNGSGKSTLSKIIIGVLKPKEGHIKIFGNEMTNKNITSVRQYLGIVFQNPDNQFIGSTVKDDIAFGLENRCLKQEDMQPIIDSAAKKVGMQDFLDHEPLMLSGGQKQRVAIASVLALSPEIIIFDEATSMLDPKGKKEVKKIMLELKETRKKTIISITHDMDEIINADKVLVMNKGELVKAGTPEEILKNKEFIKSIHLDVPFVVNLHDEISKQGLKLEETLSLEKLVEEICQK